MAIDRECGPMDEDGVRHWPYRGLQIINVKDIFVLCFCGPLGRLQLMSAVSTPMLSLLDHISVLSSCLQSLETRGWSDLGWRTFLAQALCCT